MPSSERRPALKEAAMPLIGKRRRTPNFDLPSDVGLAMETRISLTFGQRFFGWTQGLELRSERSSAEATFAGEATLRRVRVDCSSAWLAAINVLLGGLGKHGLMSQGDNGSFFS